MKKIIISLFLSVIFMFVCVTNVDATNEKNERIYYINSADMNRLYSMKSDGSGIKKLSDTIVSNAWEYKNYIYFTVRNADSFPAQYGMEECGIFRIKKDGSNELNINNDFEDYTDDLFVSDKYVAFWDDEGYLMFYDSDHSVYDDTDYGYPIDAEGISIRKLKNYKIRSISDKYLYLSDKSGKTFYRTAIGDDIVKPEKINKLPASKQKKLDVLSTDYYCEKYLEWKAVKGADNYIISRLNKKTDKYTKFAQTSETSIRIEVPANELNAEYKVVASVNGRSKIAKLVEFEDKEKFLGVGSSEVLYNGKLYAYVNYGLYVYDFEKNDPVLIYDDYAENIFIQDDIIYFYNDGLFSMDIDGKNIRKLVSDKDTDGNDVNNIIYTDKSIYFICSRDMDDLECGDSIYCYDREKENISAVVTGKESCREHFFFITFADDRIIYTYGNGKIAGINKNGERKYIADDFARYYYKVYNGEIYFFNNGLCRINPDGTGFERFSSDFNIVSSEYLIYNDKIYYKEYIGYTVDSFLCSCDFYGNNKTRILEDVENVDEFIIVDDMLYYTTSPVSGWFGLSLLQ